MFCVYKQTGYIHGHWPSIFYAQYECSVDGSCRPYAMHIFYFIPLVDADFAQIDTVHFIIVICDIAVTK